MGLFKKISKWGAGLAAFSASGLASAAASQPKDWQITFQEAASENMTMITDFNNCLLYTSPSPRDGLLSRMPSSA